MVLDLLHHSPETAMDRGPWQLMYRSDGELSGVESNDFKHDVGLKVTGDFDGPEQFKAYCEWLAAKLNADPT